MSKSLQVGSVRRWALLWALTPALAIACYDRGDRWLPQEEPPPVCELGSTRCNGALERCEAGTDGPQWAVLDDCQKQDLVCAPALQRCTTCVPKQRRCDDQTVLECDEEGQAFVEIETCESNGRVACREGSCLDLCGKAREERSNVGCEYWAIDLDNAMINPSLNAAAQQFAVVISNAQPDVPAEVTIERDDTAPGEENDPLVVTRATVPPFSLTVFKLGPREVDGSAPGEYDTGTHTALTRAGYRIRTTVPVVAYQFNPLENVDVFSNDASLLKPVEALLDGPGVMRDSYVVLGWPQTIASTDDPRTNFDPNDPDSHLRAFLTIAATRPDTRVEVIPTTRVLGGGPVDDTEPGESIEIALEPFDVLNLETNDFNADFTGSLIRANQPIVVFSGSEASDAPWFTTLDDRECCADHLEEQLDPIRTAGKYFVASVSPNRTAALAAAGANVGVSEQLEFYRAVAVTPGGARLRITAPGGVRSMHLPERGDMVEIATPFHFIVESDNPIMLGSVSPSQDAARVPSGLPGGDPSFMIIPPVEQFRRTYVFLTPDKYAFDFIRIIAPPDTDMLFDGRPLAEALDCDRRSADSLDSDARGSSEPPFWVYTCQLSFPIIDPDFEAEALVREGMQNDGVHRLEATRPIGLLVDGFDNFVSYAYAGGTDLSQIVPE